MDVHLRSAFHPLLGRFRIGAPRLERSASRKVGSLNRFIILRADSSLELMQDTPTEHDSGEEADRSSSVSMEDLAWSRRVRGSLRSCGLRRDSRFETAQLGRE
jgi:hypothetical protein